jgi:hypothetical protein
MPPQFKKLTPEQGSSFRKQIKVQSLVRKLKILGFSTFFGTTIITFVLGMVIFSGDFLFSVPETGAISFDDFVHKYLPTGEVKRIVFHANKQRAIAYLHDGAIIEGRPHPEPVFIRYDRAVSGQPDQFTSKFYDFLH